MTRNQGLRSASLACTALVSLGLSEEALGAAPIPATPKTLAARIAAAKPGDTIQLTSGNYGALVIARRTFAGAGVTIQAQPGAKAVFNAVQVDGVRGLTLKDIEVSVEQTTPGDPVFGVIVNASTNVRLNGLHIHGPPGPPQERFNAALFRGDTDLTMSDSDIRQFGTGINILESDHVQMLRNTLSDMRTDGFRGNSSHVSVIGNHASNFHPIPGDHPDFVQFWGVGVSSPPTGNRIQDNVYERGERGGGIQGVFIEDNRDIIISGNALLGSMYDAISLARVQGALIENNFVQGYPDMGVEIITRGGSSNVTIRANVAPVIESRIDDGKQNTGYRSEDNRRIGVAAPGDASAMKAWLAAKPPR